MLRHTLPLVLLAAAAACGDDNPNNTPDARPMDDAGVDASETTGTVKLTVLVAGEPVAGVRVHFQNADSSLVTSADTDASGVASAVMAGGGFVTAIDPFDNQPTGLGDYTRNFTYAGVKPGDELVLSDGESSGTTPLQVTGPIDEDASVTRYQLSTACGWVSASPDGDNFPTGTLVLDEACQPTTDILITSHDADDEVVHWLYQDNVSSAAPADLSASPITGTPTAKQVTFANISGLTGYLGAGVELHATRGRLFDTEVTGDIEFPHTFNLPLFPNAVELVSLFASAPYGAHALGDWGPASGTAYTVDVGARLLREATSVPEYDATMKQVVWTEAATGAVAELAQTEVGVQRGANYIEWHLIAPVTGPSIQFPTLPVEGTDYNITEQDTVDFVQVLTAKVTGGYDTVRESLFTGDGLELVETGLASGSMTAQIIHPNQLVAPLAKLTQPFLPAPRKSPSAWKIRGRM